MITEEVLDCVKVGILTDQQLDQALNHYRDLEKNLKCHGEKYHLVWKDVFHTLLVLEGYKKSRKSK
jgi:hypothetical protein